MLCSRAKLPALALVTVVGLACGPGEIGSGNEPIDVGDPRAAIPNESGVEAPGVPSGPGESEEPDVQGHGGDEPVALPMGDAERPWEHNTGPSNPTALVSSSSLSITTDGAVYEDLEIFGGIWIDASDVTIRNFRINGEFSEFYGINIAPGNSGIVVEDGEIFNIAGSGIRGLGYTARRLYIHDNNDDGLRPEGPPGSGPTLIEHSFIEKMGLSDGAHADALQVSGVSEGSYDLTLQYNNFYMPAPDTPGHPGDASKASAVIFIAKPVSNFLIQNNWLDGGGYTVYCGSNTQDVIWRNNVFGDYYSFGPVTGDCQHWSENVWEDNGEPVPSSY